MIILAKLTITKDANGEYRVPGPNGTEAQAYYTDDKADALDTARLEHPLTVFKFRTVAEHPVADATSYRIPGSTETFILPGRLVRR